MVVAIFLALSIVILMQTTLKAQRKLENLADEDLRSYYLAHSGYVYAVERLRSLDRYEERWYAPQKSFQGREQFGALEKGSKAEFRYYLQEVSRKGKFHSLFLISRGIYLGPPRPGQEPFKNITVIKSRVKFTPPPPTAKGVKQSLYVAEASILNKQSLLEFIQDPRFKDFFHKKDGSQNPALSKLFDFLADGDLETMDFESHPELLEGLAMLDDINSQIRNYLRIGRLVTDPDRIDSSLLEDKADLVCPADPMQYNLDTKGQNDFLKMLSQKTKYGEEAVKDWMKELPRDVYKSLLLERIQEVVGQWPEGSVMKMEPSTGGMFNLIQTQIVNPETILEGAKKLLDRNPDLSATQLLDMFREHEPVVLVPNGDEIPLSTVSQDSSKSQTSDDTQVDPLPPPEDEPDPDPEDNDDSAEETPKEPPVLAVEPIDETTGTTDSEGDSDATSEPSDEPGTDPDNPLYDEEFNSDALTQDQVATVVQDFMGDQFEGIDFSMSPYDSNLSNSFMRIFMQHMVDDLQELILEKRMFQSRNPSREEYAQYFAQNPMPDRAYVQQISDRLEQLYNDDSYSLHYGGVVRDPYDPDDAGRYTVMNWSRNDFKRELQQKLQNYHRKNPIRDNASFARMFDRSAWADSTSHSYLGKDRANYDREWGDHYFMQDRQTGERVKLYDYITR